MKIKRKTNMIEKLDNLEQDSKQRKINLIWIQEDYVKDFKLKIVKITILVSKSKILLQDWDNFHLLSKKLLIMKEKLVWPLKKFNVLIEFWETEIMSLVQHNPTSMIWNWTSKELQHKFNNWERNMRLNLPKDNNLKEDHKN